MHKLLQRQLRKHLGTDPPDPRLAAFLAAVDAAYEENDRDRALLERSMELASAELMERNTRLQRDLESIKRLELELRQAEKLRAVGQLAAGIAHEINTPVQFLGDSLRFLKEAFNDLMTLGEPCRALCAAARTGHDALELARALESRAEEIDLGYLVAELPKAFDHTEEGVRRVAGIVLAMKEFGRPDSREKVPVAVKRCIDNALLVAHSELKYAAEIEVSARDLPSVPGYPGDLNQVLLNLLVNAAHAIVDRYGAQSRCGLIRVRAESDADWVTVTVSDNGCGISAEHRARIFEPFFTTKGVGRGSGQGLAIARAIVVEKHGGTLTFDSVPNEGTTFELKLPLCERTLGASVGVDR
jgi:signal transduction histidine kinase